MQGNISQNKEVYTLQVSSPRREERERNAAVLKARISWGTIVFFLGFLWNETEKLHSIGPPFLNQVA